MTVRTRSINRSSETKDVSAIVAAGLAKRYAAERRFRAYGIGAIGVAVAFVGLLFVSIIGKGYTAFWQTHMRLDVELAAEIIDPRGTREAAALQKADYTALIKQSLRERFPDAKKRNDKRMLYRLASQGGSFDLRSLVSSDPQLIGQRISVWVPVSDDADMLVKGHISRDGENGSKRISAQEISWLDELAESGDLEEKFNTAFFTAGDSREPELAGVWGAAVGSALTLLVTLALAFPFGVATAVYLEEFAPKNRWTNLVEVNINNLAAVPSIVFGLLGLAVFLNFFGMPRSAPLAGGFVLAIMTLPTIIITGRVALTSVPPSVREAAYGIGASPVQAVFHHVLPLAMPGMLTGAIIGMARALGETAPLLMIGMVAFIVDIPSNFTDPSTVLPVQVYLWADSPERAFVEKTSAAIMVLLAFLVIMNGLAVYLRKKFEIRW